MIQEHLSIIETKKLKKIILSYIHDLQGKNTQCFNMNKKHNSITDFIILCSGRSNRHVISIAHDILKKLHNMGLPRCDVEGIKFGEWILIDLGDIIIHIMQHEIRNLYELEKLWF